MLQEQVKQIRKHLKSAEIASTEDNQVRKFKALGDAYFAAGVAAGILEGSGKEYQEGELIIDGLVTDIQVLEDI